MENIPKEDMEKIRHLFQQAINIINSYDPYLSENTNIIIKQLNSTRPIKVNAFYL